MRRVRFSLRSLTLIVVVFCFVFTFIGIKVQKQITLSHSIEHLRDSNVIFGNSWKQLSSDQKLGYDDAITAETIRVLIKSAPNYSNIKSKQRELSVLLGLPNIKHIQWVVDSPHYFDACQFDHQKEIMSLVYSGRTLKSYPEYKISPESQYTPNIDISGIFHSSKKTIFKGLADNENLRVIYSLGNLIRKLSIPNEVVLETNDSIQIYNLECRSLDISIHSNFGYSPTIKPILPALCLHNVEAENLKIKRVNCGSVIFTGALKVKNGIDIYCSTSPEYTGLPELTAVLGCLDTTTTCSIILHEREQNRKEWVKTVPTLNISPNVTLDVVYDQ
jgi:hypothetical protein